MLNSLIKQLNIFFKNSAIFRNVFTLVSGTVIAQLIPLILQPILRRLYSPEDFGAFAIYITTVSVLAVICSLRYEQAIIIPGNDIQAANILSLSIVFASFFSIVLIILVFFFKYEISHLIKFPTEYRNWLFVIPFSVLLYISYEGINYWLIRMKKFRSSSINKVAKRGVEGVTLISFGILKPHGGLFWGDILGSLANILSGIYQLRKSGFKFKFISKVKMAFSFKKHIDFPKYNLFPTLLNTMSSAIPIFIINNNYSKATVGHFDLSRQALSIPAALITASIFQVLYQKISENYNKRLSVKKEIIDLFLVLFFISIIEVVTVFLFGTYIFKFIFGEQWYLSGEYSRILVFSYAIKFLVSPLSAVFIPLGRIRIGSAWQVFYFLLISVFFFIKDLSFDLFLIYYVLFDLLAYFIFLYLIFYVVKDYETKINFPT